MASSFDRWEKDPFFGAAEEVQESADRMESTYRTWVHATKDTSSLWNSDELRRDLNTTLSTAKWQLEEFERAVRLSYNRSSSEVTRNRHQDFISAIEEKIREVEHPLNETGHLGEASLPWLHLDEEEQYELALFISGMPAAKSNYVARYSSRDLKSLELNDNDPVSNCSKNLHVSFRWGEPKEDITNGHHRAASADADIGSWKIAVSDDPQQWSSSSGSSGPTHKVASLSGFLSSMEPASLLKWPRNGYRKLSHHKETDNAILPTSESNKGKNAYERNKSSLDSFDECYDEQLYGWYGAIQRRLQRSQYRVQYNLSVRISVPILILLCLIVLIAFRAV